MPAMLLRKSKSIAGKARSYKGEIVAILTPQSLVSRCQVPASRRVYSKIYLFRQACRLVRGTACGEPMSGWDEWNLRASGPTLLIFRPARNAMNKVGKVLIGLAVIVMLGAAFSLLFRPSEEEVTLKAPGDATNPHGGPGNGGPDASRISSSADDFGSNMTFEQIKIEAEHGSAKAQRKLSDIYAFCAPYSLGPEKWLATLDALATLTPASVNGIASVKKRLAVRCNEVDSGQPIPAEAYRLWMEQAARGGDVASKVKIRTWTSQPLLARETSVLLDEVLSSDDPDALLEMSQLMSRPVTGELSDRYRQIAGDATTGAAWGIAACRAGASCGEGSLMMDSVCMSTGKCNYRTYEDFLVSEAVTPAERARMNLIASNILRMRSH